jgi:hypothetical protein
MSPERDDAIFLRWPDWFANRGNTSISMMKWGFECGDGWYKIIWELFERLEPVVAESEAEGPFEVLQIKQKMGGLRVYLSRTNAAIKDAIMVAQERSIITCELCGEPGSIDWETEWYQVLCTSCRAHTQNQLEP